ncbi:MAG: hypothetical protein O4859_31670 [Trichodesmium sp. St18_bin1]|nr:hypothetical protein [Trichodesmium sp. St18_bin1]
MFNLDFAQGIEIDYLSKFSGWYIPKNNCNIKLNLHLNSQPYVSLLHSGYRPDVAAAFPGKKYASHSSFWGEILLPENIKLKTDVKIEIFIDKEEETLLFQNQFKVIGQPLKLPTRGEKF